MANKAIKPTKKIVKSTKKGKKSTTKGASRRANMRRKKPSRWAAKGSAKSQAEAGRAELAAGSSDLTRAVDAGRVAQRVSDLSEITGAAGALDVSEGAAMLDKGSDIEAMAAAVGAMSKEDLERGLELARIAGELWTAGDLAELMQMPVLSEVLETRGMRLQEIAVEVLLRFTGTRALAQAMKETGAAVETMGREEIAEGLVRMAASEAMAERSAELSQASDDLARQAVTELEAADAAAEAAQAV